MQIDELPAGEQTQNPDLDMNQVVLSGVPEGQASYHHAAVLRYSPPAEHFLSCHFCYIPYGRSQE